LTYGAINHSCVVQFQQFHFVVGVDRLYTTDGFSVQFPAEQRVEDTFFKELAGRNSVHVEHYQRNNEIVLWYNSVSDGRKALIWNYVSNTWTTLAFGPIAAVAYGPYQPAQPETYDTITTTYQTETRLYDDFSIEALGTYLYMATEEFNDGQQIFSPYLLIADRSKVYTGSPLYLGQPARAQRTGIDLDELTKNSETMKRIVRITPQIDAYGAGQIRFRVGGQHTTDGPVAWKPWVAFSPGTQKKVDVRATYRYLAWEIEASSDTWFRMGGMELDVVETTRR
jgi:hypothetical protein